MSSAVQSGYFLVADISGYTKFLAETELEHAKGILEDLFDAILPNFKAPVKISGLRGDAVFSYAIDDDIVSSQFVLDIAEKVYGAFAEKKDRIKINTACACSACKNMDDLDLKVFVHHGEFILQKSGDTEELAGTDVNTLFRLMKNDVVEDTGINAYALITCDALRKMNLGDFFPKETFHTATYEHVGEIEFVVHDLRKSWEQKRDARRQIVSEDDDLLIAEATTSIPVSPEAAFVMCSRPDLRRQIVDADVVEALNKKGAVLEQGSIYHCHHGKDIIVIEIVDWRPGEYLTVVYQFPFKMTVMETTEFVPYGEGTLVKMRYGQIIYQNLWGNIMSRVIKSKTQKLFSDAMVRCSANMTKLGQTLLQDNPEIAAGDGNGGNVIDIKRAVEIKIAS
jgi:hypothetical protein